MEFVQFDCKTAKTGAILMYWLDNQELPYTVYCPSCKEFLITVLSRARGTFRMNCAECDKLVQITFAGK